MMEIDGAIGYGQVLRTAVSLSALTLKAVRIFNIRKDRPKPGLMAQHLAGVRTAGEFCDAEVKGLEIGSTEVEFSPRRHSFGYKSIDIGTAGQISLLLQTITPLLVFADKDVSLEIAGGTAGLGAPTMDYLKHVFYPLASRMGLKEPEIDVARHGFYPRGRGMVNAVFHPAEKLHSLNLLERGRLKYVKGLSVAGSLPMHVAERQAKSAKDTLKNYGVSEIEIQSVATATASPGTCLTVWAYYENTIIGSDIIGKKGVPAERVGKECADGLIDSVESGAALDKWMSDQMLVFMALASGKSAVKTERFTDHVKSNIMIIERMLDVKFESDEVSKTIEVEGCGFGT